MCYYYYKDGEKIGPVEFIKISDPLKSREITPETVVEQEDGNQLPALKLVFSPFGDSSGEGHSSSRLSIFDYIKLYSLLGMFLCPAVMVLAGVIENNILLLGGFAAIFALVGVVVWADRQAKSLKN